jgi:hypothetical protein
MNYECSLELLMAKEELAGYWRAVRRLCRRVTRRG